MQYLLQREEKSSIKKQFNNNVIYKAFKAPCEEYEASSKGFKLSPEEVFWECITALDDIREHPEDLTFNYQDFWKEKYNDYRDLYEEDLIEGLEEAASIVTMCLVLCLNTLNSPKYNTLTLLLMCQLEENCSFLFALREKFTSNLYILGEDRFKEAVNDYIYSDNFISDDIDELLNNVPQKGNSEDIISSKTNSSNESLSLRQLLILLDVGFDIGFTTETTNVSAYAKLIAMMIGGNPGSIRTTMNRMKNIDYSSKGVKEDVKYLIQLLEPVKVDLAIKLKKQIINED